MIAKSLFAVLPLVGLARGHAAIFHKSVWGMNVTQTNSPQYSRDNRAVAPLRQLSFNQWWFHGHLDQPPHPDDVMELPAGGKVTTEIACDIGATSLWPWGPGGDHQAGNNPCPNSFTEHIHANNENDLGGCALAIAYKSEASEVKPEDFVVFSVNHRCVWDRFTDFQIPANMPACPNGKCICGWYWQHREDAGGDEMYMNNFQCNITGANGTTPIPAGQVPVRCVDDPAKCVKGAKQPFYWDQAEGNNMFEGIYTPPLYLNTYGFADGAQNDIWDTIGGSVPAASKSADVTPTVTASTSAAAATPSTTAAATDSSSVEAPGATTVSQESGATTAAQEPSAATTTAQEPSATTTSQEPEAPAATSSSEAVVSTTPAQAQAANPTTPVSSDVPTSAPASAAEPTSVDAPTSTSSTSLVPTSTQGSQGQRTCRAKKHKRSIRHQRRSRRSL
ncbi:unnamed protein product [Rhizoctonia solani]|uniref:Uncharacterized protein n=1 Tax=Rhizoctonia solani TaxID=456999 RepID=A0A8H3AXG7_9AGAM|nr:unnamed protein product [Rhizoctonia solani]